MKDQEYLDAISASQVMRERVGTFRNRYAALLPDVTLTGMFISEIRDTEGLRVWESLWFWGENYIAEMKNFLSQDTFDGSFLGHISIWDMSLVHFEIGSQPSDRSRVSLKFSFGDDLSANLRASAENCSHLIEFFREVVQPRVTA